MVKSSRSDTPEGKSFTGSDPERRPSSYHAHYKTEPLSETISFFRIFPVSRFESMVEAAHDLAGCARIAIRRFVRLTVEPATRNQFMAAFDRTGLSLSEDELKRRVQLLADEISGLAPVVSGTDPFREPLFLSACTLRDGAATELPADCAAAMVVSPGEQTRILVSNRLGLAETANLSVHLVAAAIVNRAAHLGLVSDTPRLIQTLAQIAGAQPIDAEWRFVAVRDCGAVRYGSGLVVRGSAVAETDRSG